MPVSSGDCEAVSVVVPTNAELGRAIRRLRRARRMTIEGLAHAADMHPTYLSGIERGVRNPTWDKLTGLARALDVPVATIARDAEAEAQLAARMRIARSELGLSERFA
ncbi:MAG TPA: helix-turn-helix transcriptional regulator [Solirubrobacteraceae bacterium]|nr:helix-turn-helix transcriptional regulator [Solirubrobacteraceae bacterium]